MSTAVEVNYNAWDTSSIKYGTPKINKVGGKSINVLNPNTNRFVQVVLPTMDTWGINDFMNKDTGESDGKFKISLIFPVGDYATPETDLALQKFKDFEAKILEDAAKNSELWWGEQMPKDVLKHMLFPGLKYSKDPKTKKVDYSKSPNLSAKVVNYGDKWNVDIYDTQYNRLFPSDNPDVTPIDLVQKLSKVTCILECGGIWIGGKGWGITWKLVECVVKPRDQVKASSGCRIKVDSASYSEVEPVEEVVLPPKTPVVKKPVVEVVEDSDNEEPEPEQEQEQEPEQEQEQETPSAVPESIESVLEEEVVQDSIEPVIKKKVIKKVATAVKDEDVEPAAAAVPKKVIKKVVAKK